MSAKPSKVLVIGSGPIVIGQAAEFDYASLNTEMKTPPGKGGEDA